MLKQLRAGASPSSAAATARVPTRCGRTCTTFPFWMAHIHFSVLTCSALGASTSVGKAILLDDIIDWLERDPEYFVTANLTFAVGERDPLFSKLEEVVFATKV